MGKRVTFYIRPGDQDLLAEIEDIPDRLRSEWIRDRLRDALNAERALDRRITRLVTLLENLFDHVESAEDAAEAKANLHVLLEDALYD